MIIVTSVASLKALLILKCIISLKIKNTDIDFQIKRESDIIKKILNLNWLLVTIF